ncbi:MAG: type II toxin-antitoxin system VapC family toxin [Verrucomicrobia bacterium]|nr:type II toxin-antitoxin system VapC family toxin [Verrucomicrobiota bacterium]
MKLLLDTHVFLWWIKGDRRLPKNTKSKISQAEDVFVSSASIWEATIKIKLKKLDVDVNRMVNAITESGFAQLPILVEHAAAVSRLPDIHRDPFDRILIAQAIVEPLTFLTADAELKSYSELVEIID